MERRKGRVSEGKRGGRCLRGGGGSEIAGATCCPRDTRMHAAQRGRPMRTCAALHAFANFAAIMDCSTFAAPAPAALGLVDTRDHGSPVAACPAALVLLHPFRLCRPTSSTPCGRADQHVHPPPPAFAAASSAAWCVGLSTTTRKAAGTTPTQCCLGRCTPCASWAPCTCSAHAPSGTSS